MSGELPIQPSLLRLALVSFGLSLLFPMGCSRVDPSPQAETSGTRQAASELLTSGQPTQQQLTELAAAGYRTVINLRTEKESGFEWERQLAMELGLQYHEIPIGGTADLNRANVERLASVLEKGHGPFLIHCKSGNRVGAMLALKAVWLDGTEPNEALRLGRAAGMTTLEAATQELFEGPN